MNSTTQNIYAATTLAPHDAQLLLALALFCLILGVFLVEKKTLLALSRVLLFTKPRGVPSHPSA